MRVLLFAKPKPGLTEVLSILDQQGCEVCLFQGQRTDPFPSESYGTGPDLTLSYMSPWVIPERILRETKKWAINFHPGPPEYPGIGCTNFALYEGASEYGVTAHLMERQVDSGRIIGVRRFPIEANETVYSLTEKSYRALVQLFQGIMSPILAQDTFPKCHEVWKRHPFTRQELEALCRVQVDMPQEEVRRRIHATTYPSMPGAYLEWMGYKFEYNPNR
jgi:methionyl-tRNA formyltransferase